MCRSSVTQTRAKYYILEVLSRDVYRHRYAVVQLSATTHRRFFFAILEDVMYLTHRVYNRLAYICSSAARFNVVCAVGEAQTRLDGGYSIDYIHKQMPELFPPRYSIDVDMCTMCLRNAAI